MFNRVTLEEQKVETECVGFQVEVIMSKLLTDNLSMIPVHNANHLVFTRDETSYISHNFPQSDSISIYLIRGFI